MFNGSNIRDWLFVEDHLNALILLSKFGKIWRKLLYWWERRKIQ